MALSSSPTTIGTYTKELAHAAKRLVAAQQELLTHYKNKKISTKHYIKQSHQLEQLEQKVHQLQANQACLQTPMMVFNTAVERPIELSIHDLKIMADKTQTSCLRTKDISRHLSKLLKWSQEAQSKTTALSLDHILAQQKRLLTTWQSAITTSQYAINNYNRCFDKFINNFPMQPKTQASLHNITVFTKKICQTWHQAKMLRDRVAQNRHIIQQMQRWLHSEKNQTVRKSLNTNNPLSQYLSPSPTSAKRRLTLNISTKPSGGLQHGKS